VISQEQRILHLVSVLKAAGIQCEDLPRPENFDPEQLNKLME
jgi:hypothetical protein